MKVIDHSFVSYLLRTVCHRFILLQLLAMSPRIWLNAFQHFWTFVILFDVMLYLPRTSAALKMPLLASIATAISSSVQVSALTFPSHANTLLYIISVQSASLVHQMFYARQSLNPSISNQSRSPGDAQVDTAHWYRCFGQFHGWTNWQLCVVCLQCTA